MAEMNRDRDQNQGGNRQSQGQDRNRDMQGGRSQEHQSQKQQWDGNERRTGAERRTEGNMQMNEGSSR